MWRIKPGAAGWEASMLPLCYAAPHQWVFNIKVSTGYSPSNYHSVGDEHARALDHRHGADQQEADQNSWREAIQILLSEDLVELAGDQPHSIGQELLQAGYEEQDEKQGHAVGAKRREQGLLEVPEPLEVERVEAILVVVLSAFVWWLQHSETRVDNFELMS